MNTKEVAFKKKLNFQFPFDQSDINYSLVNTKEYRPDSLSEANYDILYDELILSAKQSLEEDYKAQFQDTNDKDLIKENKINYFLIGLIDPLKIDEQFKSRLKEWVVFPNSRVNIAAIYEAGKTDKISSIIPEMDKELDVNTIYQDNTIEIDGHKYLTISAIDINDNMVSIGDGSLLSTKFAKR